MRIQANFAAPLLRTIPLGMKALIYAAPRTFLCALMDSNHRPFVCKTNALTN